MAPGSKSQSRGTALHHDKIATHFSSSRNHRNAVRNNHNDNSRSALPSTKFPFTSSSAISVNLTKSKIRNVRRALEHSQDSMPPGIRIEKERALAGYIQDLDRAVEEKKRNEMISKYHMVRFFERKKAERALKKARARLSSLHGTRGISGNLRGGEGVAAAVDKDKANEEDRGDDEQEEDAAKQAVHIAEVDVQYTVNYPLTEKYVSLYPKSSAKSRPSPARRLSKRGEGRDEDEDEDVAESGSASPMSSNLPKPPIWPFVEQCMTTRTLDQLRNGKFGIMPDGQVKTRAEYAPETMSRNDRDHRGDRNSKAKSKASPVGNRATETESDDGGFFEK